jgi:hypothetical protein
VLCDVAMAAAASRTVRKKLEVLNNISCSNSLLPYIVITVLMNIYRFISIYYNIYKI